MKKNEVIERYGIEEYERRKEQHKQYQKQYYQDNKEEIKQYKKQYNDEHKQPCVYAYTDLDGFVVYIGSTSNLKKRECYRRTNKNNIEPFVKIYQASPDQYICHVLQYTDTIEEARELEKRFIGALNPRYNILCKTV